MTLNEAVRERIKSLCKENNITINALASKAGMPRTTLKNIMYRTSKNTGIMTIYLICDAIGISLSEFFSDSLFESVDPVKD